MTNTPRPDTAPEHDEAPKAKGEKTPLEKMRDLTRRVVNVHKEDLPKPKPTKRRAH